MSCEHPVCVSEPCLYPPRRVPTRTWKCEESPLPQNRPDKTCPGLTFVYGKAYTAVKNPVQVSIFYRNSKFLLADVTERLAFLFTRNSHAEKIQLSETGWSHHTEHLPAPCVNTHTTHSSASLLRSVVILPEGVGRGKIRDQHAYRILLFNLNHVVL